MPAGLRQQIGFVGAGRMATALAQGLVRAEMLAAASILASDPSDAARSAFARDVPGASVLENNRPVVSQADVVLLAVKPQKMSEVLADIRDAIRADALVVSIAAGVTLNRLAAGLPPRQRIVRVMPNTPCLIGQGASAYSLGESCDGGGRRTGRRAALGGGRRVRSAGDDVGCGDGPVRVGTGIRV